LLQVIGSGIGTLFLRFKAEAKKSRFLLFFLKKENIGCFTITDEISRCPTLDLKRLIGFSLKFGWGTLAELSVRISVKLRMSVSYNHGYP